MKDCKDTVKLYMDEIDDFIYDTPWSFEQRFESQGVVDRFTGIQTMDKTTGAWVNITVKVVLGKATRIAQWKGVKIVRTESFEFPEGKLDQLEVSSDKTFKIEGVTLMNYNGIPKIESRKELERYLASGSLPKDFHIDYSNIKEDMKLNDC